jgi:8-oxo-dGTP pyrophosphatase MutT (NUDIX family)
MKKIKASGFILFRQKEGRWEFLLMKHASRWDLPKGHVDDGETLLEAAYRELFEETGIREDQIVRDPEFCYQDVYYPTYPNSPKGSIEKSLYIYRGILKDPDVVPALTEHSGYEWFAWNPPHSIQKETIDSVLGQVRIENNI